MEAKRFRSPVKIVSYVFVYLVHSPTDTIPNAYNLGKSAFGVLGLGCYGLCEINNGVCHFRDWGRFRDCVQWDSFKICC